WSSDVCSSDLACPGERQFTFGGAVGVIEGRGGRASFRDPPQIVNGQGAIEPALLAVPLGLLELQQFKNLRRFRKLALDHNALTSSTDARRRVGAARNSLSSVCPAPRSTAHAA